MTFEMQRYFDRLGDEVENELERREEGDNNEHMSDPTHHHGSGHHGSLTKHALQGPGSTQPHPHTAASETQPGVTNVKDNPENVKTVLDFIIPL